MPTILICPDSFKGSISAPDAARAIADGIAAARPTLTPICLPVADGGEGTLDALCPPDRCIEVDAHDPLGRPIRAKLGLRQGGVAVIEMAQAAGLCLLAPDERDPRAASTAGVGELITAALDRDCRRLLITVGGSATNDGGAGMLAALGMRFYRASGESVIPTAGELTQISRIDPTTLDARLRDCAITVATDVANPLCGDHGATAVYGPQKGADETACATLEAGLQHLGALIDAAADRAVSTLPGVGAGGGLPLGLVAFAEAKLCRGIDAVLDALDFDAHLGDDTLAVITGEGRTDGQSAWGKAVAGVALRASARGVPTYILSGALGCDETDLDALEAAGVRGVMSVLDAPASLADAMTNASDNLRRAGSRLARLLAPADRREAALRCAVSTLHATDASVVIVRPGEGAQALGGRGIAPLVHALRADARAFAGCAVADKIVGLAAAYLFAHGGVSAVHGEVMSEAAEAWLTAQGIPHSAGEVVERIINRRGDGICPMEARALTLGDWREAFAMFDAVVE